MDPVLKQPGTPVVVSQDIQKQQGQLKQQTHRLTDTAESAKNTALRSKQQHFVGRTISLLPEELLVQIFFELPLTDATHCRQVCQQFKAVLDRNHLPARIFHRSCHPFGRSPADRNAITNYERITRQWLMSFNSESPQVAEELDRLQQHRYFPEILFFTVARTLAREKKLTLQPEAYFELTPNPFSNIGFPKIVCLSADGALLLSTVANGPVRVYEHIRKGHYRLYQLDHSTWINDACFSPDGTLIGTALGDKKIKISRIEDNRLLEMAVLTHHDHVESIRFSPDGTKAVTTANHWITLWTLKEKKWQHTTSLANVFFLRKACFSPDGAYVAVSSNDGRATIMKLVGESLLEQTSGEHSIWMEEVCFSCDGTRMITAPTEESICIWKLKNGRWEEQEQINLGDRVHLACFSPDDTRIAIALTEHVKVFSHTNGTWHVQATLTHYDRIHSVVFSPDGRHLLTTSNDRTAELWGVVDGKWQARATLEDDRDNFIHAEVSPDGTHILAASIGHIYFWGIAGLGHTMTPGVTCLLESIL